MGFMAKKINRFLYILRELGLISYDTWWYFDEKLLYKYYRST